MAKRGRVALARAPASAPARGRGGAGVASGGTEGGGGRLGAAPLGARQVHGYCLIRRQGLAVDYLKVLDFGLSRPILTPEEGRLTADFAITGSPAWISPEAAMDEAQLDHRADIYGLGCVAYWLLCGKPVFEAEQAMRLVMAHVGADVVPPSMRLGRELPEDLQALVLRCLAKRPTDRPQSAMDLKAQLQACDVGEWSDAGARQWWQQHGQTRAQTVEQLRADRAHKTKWVSTNTFTGPR